MLSLSKTAYYYAPKLADDSNIANKLLELAEKYPKYGFGLMFNLLRNQGHTWNHKRVYRIYKENNLHLRKKPKKRLPSRNPTPLLVPSIPNQCWSIDFMSDVLSSGRKFRTFNVIDDYNRQALAIILDTSLPGMRITLELERLCHIHGYPASIRLDNGPEMISSILSKWAKDNNVKLEFIEPGKPAQNAYIERFNRTYREEVLDMYIFTDLEMVKIITEQWRHEYNNNRPHMALKGKSPNDYLKQAA